MPDTNAIDIPSRTFSALRNALFEELDNLRSGNGDVSRVRAVCAIAGKINDTMHAEVKVRRMLGESAGGTASLQSML